MSKLITFKEQVNETIKDLLNYPKKDLKLLARKMNINCDNKTDDIICNDIATQIVYINTHTLPFYNREKCERFTKKLSNEKLSIIRKNIYEKYKKYSQSISKISIIELRQLFEDYDNQCFNGDLQKYIFDKQYILEFKTSGEKTFTTEGICMTTCNYTITIPVNFFDKVNGIVNVAGLLCNDQLECLQRVIEHEIIHLIIFMMCDDKLITEQHGQFFMDIAKDLFRHTDYRHYMF